MKYRKSAGTIMAALLLSSSGAVRAQPAVEIPTTMSPEAQAQASNIYAMRAKMYSSLSTEAPLPADEETRNRQLNAILGPINQKIADSVLVKRTTGTLGGVPIVRFDPRVPSSPGRILIYVHGGAYIHFSASVSIGIPALISDEAHLSVISVDYTLAPQGHPDSATSEVLAVYRALLVQGIAPAHIGIFGDSAGGGLAAASVLRMRDEGLKLPGAVYLMSPWMDISNIGDTQTTLAGKDPFLTRAQLDFAAKAYAGDNRKAPYASPVYGDYSKAFPATLIQAGTHEILLSDAVRAYQAMRSGGNEAVLDIYEGMPHVFQSIFVGAPESRTAFKRAAEFFNRHLTP